MSEQEAVVPDFALFAGDTGSPGAPATQDAAQDPASDAAKQQGSKIDDALKDAFRRALSNPDLACLVTDLLSPGTALVRFGGGKVQEMSPLQHLLIAFGGVTLTIVATNPDIIEKLKKAVKGGAKAKALKDAGVAATTGAEAQVVKADLADDADAFFDQGGAPHGS